LMGTLTFLNGDKSIGEFKDGIQTENGEVGASVIEFKPKN